MKILIAAGGSAHSDDAVKAGTRFAQATNSPITILTVFKDPERQTEAQMIVDRAVSLANSMQDEDDSSEPGIDTKIRLGHPAEEIVSEAYEGDYHLVVVGTWPKQNLLHRLLAPTAERVVMQAPCPVLVAKGKLRSLRRMLLCISGADSPSRAAYFLTEIAAQMVAELKITVLHVMSQISVSPAVQNRWQLDATAERLMQEDTPEGRWLREDLAVLKKAQARSACCIEAKVRHGFVVDEVLREAFESDCDLLVIGAHRQAGWSRLLLDDLTHQIIIRADRPILVV